MDQKSCETATNSCFNLNCKGKYMKLVIATFLMAMTMSASAATWLSPNGIWYGNVCRNGPYYFVYSGIGFPVGSPCWFTTPYGTVNGMITSE